MAGRPTVTIKAPLSTQALEQYANYYPEVVYPPPGPQSDLLKPVRRVATTPQEIHIDKLASAVSAEHSRATFACGGIIKIARPTSPDSTPRAENDLPPSTLPVTLRFGPDGSGNVLSLSADANSDAFKKLLVACTPASFGRDGENVVDESYRKAGKLDVAAFCSDFCPYTTGTINNVVNQLLVPSLNAHRSVKAELYKLNVYSGPGGRFKPHVDTPRGSTQVGSLVVSLPSRYEGGSLSVRHRGHQTVFDWAANSANSIQWAAFYSDCEHEVHEVTSGNRITLTYNLFLVPRTDLQAGRPHGLNVSALPLAQLLKQALHDARFMTSGGELGIYLAHRYPHTHNELSKLLPGCMKGADMAAYEVARSLKLAHTLITTSEESMNAFSDEYYYNGYEEDLKENEEDLPLDEVGEVLNPCGTYHPHLMTFHVNDEMDDEGRRNPDVDLNCVMHAGKFIWLNEPTHTELSRAGLRYGNEAQLALVYTSAALLIRVPTASERAAAGYVTQDELQQVTVEIDERREANLCNREDEEEDDWDKYQVRKHQEARQRKLGRDARSAVFGGFEFGRY
ncbi:hypothetical protein LTR17_016966 [Elasticomyces elasticus]|nr:hypothetical protein LTR17_016966 [Elasticomyces elasticus]